MSKLGPKYNLLPGQEKDINKLFYRDYMVEFFDKKAILLVDLLGDAKEYVERFINRELSVNNLKFKSDDVGDSKKLEKFAKCELIDTYYHCLETFMRLFIAHALFESCPLIELTALDTHGYHKKLNQIADGNFDDLNDRFNGDDTILLVLIGNKKDSTLVNDKQLNNLKSWIILCAKELQKMNEYNSFKHGLSMLAGFGSMKITNPEDGKIVLEKEGAAIHILESKETETQYKFNLSSIFVEYDVKVALVFFYNELIKNIINNSNTDKLELKELPYDIFGLEDKQKIYMYVNDILFIKDKIFSKDNELSGTLNYWFNYFIVNGKLHLYLKDIKDIYINAHIYSPETNEYEYMIELLLSITRMQNLRIKPSKTWIYLELDEEERRQIKLIIDDFKNNHKKVFNTKKIENNSTRKTTEKTKENEKIIEILKSIKERNISFKAYVDELILQSETDYYYLSGFSTIRWYEDELNYLLLRTNNNYDLSVEVIKKLSDNIRINTIKDDGIYYDRDCQEYYTNKIKSNFKKNVDFLLSKFDASKLLEYPSELLYSDEHVFNYLFENYNCNLCKSIFGIDNPKIVGTLMYMNSVLSYYNKNIIDVKFNRYRCLYNNTFFI